jgi:predicted kinase
VVLIGPSGAGKSYWAAENFRPEQIVSSDALRAAVGASEHDQRAGADAFEVLDLILARRHGLACHAVLFDTPAEVCRARNRTRVRSAGAGAGIGLVTAGRRAVTTGRNSGQF